MGSNLYSDVGRVVFIILAVDCRQARLPIMEQEREVTGNWKIHPPAHTAQITDDTYAGRVVVRLFCYM